MRDSRSPNYNHLTPVPNTLTHIDRPQQNYNSISPLIRRKATERGRGGEREREREREGEGERCLLDCIKAPLLACPPIQAGIGLPERVVCPNLARWSWPGPCW